MLQDLPMEGASSAGASVTGPAQRGSLDGRLRARALLKTNAVADLLPKHDVHLLCHSPGHRHGCHPAGLGAGHHFLVLRVPCTARAGHVNDYGQEWRAGSCLRVGLCTEVWLIWVDGKSGLVLAREYPLAQGLCTGSAAACHPHGTDERCPSHGVHGLACFCDELGNLSRLP